MHPGWRVRNSMRRCDPCRLWAVVSNYTSGEPQASESMIRRMDSWASKSGHARKSHLALVRTGRTLAQAQACHKMLHQGMLQSLPQVMRQSLPLKSRFGGSKLLWLQGRNTLENITEAAEKCEDREPWVQGPQACAIALTTL